MKTISEYKREIIHLISELEKEHGCFVNSVDIIREFDKTSGVSYSAVTTININVS